MQLSDLLLGIIILKESNPRFDESALELGLRKTSEKYEKFKDYFNVRRSECGDKSITLDNYMFFLGMSILQDTGDLQSRYMTKYGKDYTKQELRKKYGKDIFDKLKPIAEEVWIEARKYRPFASLAK